MSPSGHAWVTLAELLRPQGRRGELLAELRTSNLELLDAPAGVYLVGKGRSAPEAGADRILIESHWQPTGRNAGRIVLKLAGCDSIDAAERLSGACLMVQAKDRPPLADDEFYISDLMGCTLYDGETIVGLVEDVEFATSTSSRVRLDDAAPLLVVQRAAGDAVLVPLIKAWLERVDLAERRIVMHLPVGLLDADAGADSDK